MARMLMRGTKTRFLPDDASLDDLGNKPLAGWYERLRGIVLRSREPASRTYRYMSRLIEKEFPRRDTGISLAFSSLDDDSLSTDALLMLAYCLQSEIESRVLLVDARLKETADGITGRLGLGGMPGYLDVLAEGWGGRTHLIQPTRVPNVLVMPAGHSGSNRSSPVNRENLEAFLGAVSGMFDHVLLQVGSIAADTRNLVTATHAETVFLLAEENRTLIRSLDECRKVLLDNGVADVRVVISSDRR